MNWAAVQSLNGGMMIGFEQIFGAPKYHIKNNESHDVYYESWCKQNNYDTKIVNMDWDLKTFNSDDDRDMFQTIKDVDIVAYVPVCSGLSMLNCSNNKDSSKCRGEANNDQNQNMYNTTSFILSKIGPKVAVFENAPTAYTALGKDVIEKLKEIAIANNYSMTLEKTTTALHGIPQFRNRTFVYFWKGDKASFIKYEHKEMPTLTDYLEEIPNTSKGLNMYTKGVDCIEDYSYKFLKHKFKFQKFFDMNKEFEFNSISGNQIIDKLQLHDEAISYYETANDFETEKERAKTIRIMLKNKQKLADGKGYWDDSCVVFNKNESINALISKNLFKIIHPTEERSLNVRELLWLMGLPHDYWMDDLPKSWQKITQSVPVATARHVAEQCKMHVEGSLQQSVYSFIKQNNEKRRVDAKEHLYEIEAMSLASIIS